MCGLGYSHVLINGEPASDAVLVTSPWNNNARRNSFSHFDLIKQASSKGDDIAIGVALGHGWRDTSSFSRKDADWRTGDETDRVLRAQVRVTFENGTITTIVPTSGDGSWLTAQGPVTADSVYNGETYDARLEQKGWALPGFNSEINTTVGDWSSATVVNDGPTGPMSPWSAPPVAVTEIIKPVSVTPHGVANSTCGVAAERDQIDLTCGGDGNVIKSVSFASYGTPSGTCSQENLARNPKCDAEVTTYVQDTCVGKASCSVMCHDNQCGGQALPSGDPCFDTAKVFGVAVVCDKPPPLANASTYIIDFGRNLAGVVRLGGISEANGTKIVMKYAEILQHEGLPDLKIVDPTAIYQNNLRSAKATDTYIANGGKSESYTPTMTYHGFRYVELSGVSQLPDSIEMLHFHSNVPHIAQTTFSSPTLNRILNMSIGSQESNMMTVPTDCDQRDERLGWMGDASLSSTSMCINFDCSAFFKSFLDSMADEMDTDGSLPDTVPWVRYGGRPADPSWSSAFPEVLYTLYKLGGEVEIVKQYFPKVMMQLGNIESQVNANGICNIKTPYGDWCPPPVTPGKGQGAKPSKPYTSVFSYVTQVMQAAEMAKAIGDSANATALETLASKLQTSFNTCFDSKATGTYDTAVMTTDVLALQIGAPQVSNKTSVTREHLVSSLQQNQNHFFTGIIGFKFLFDQLAAAGSSDVAHAVLEQTTYPSIGYEATNTLEPATSNVWELPDAPFEGTGMNSRDHHM